MSALLSGVVVKVGIYGILRLLTWLPPMPVACAAVLLGTGVVSGVLGVLYALAQHDLKRLLAYHTIENVGIIAIAISLGMLGRSADAPALAVLGYGGALLHITNHALFKGLLFLSAGAVLHGAGTLEIERLGGLAKRAPMNAALFLVGAVAICGLPPLNGFVGEWVIYAGLISGAATSVGAAGGLPAVGVFALALMGSLALACFAKVFGVVFLGTPRDSAVRSRVTPPAMNAAMIALAVACAFIGFAPGLWIPLTYGPVGTLVGVQSASIRGAYDSVLSPAATLSSMAALFACVCIALLLLRCLLGVPHGSRGRAALSKDVGTWGCGYAFPTARMQYTATSFALPLIRGFRALLWPAFKTSAPTGAFPRGGHVETHVPDLAEHDVFVPLFRGIAQVSAMFRHVTWSGAPAADRPRLDAQGRVDPLRAVVDNTAEALRKGAIQVYLSYIVITLILLFVIEAFVIQRGSPMPDRTATGPAACIGLEEWKRSNSPLP